MQVFPISEDDAQPGWGQETPQPALLPGSSFNASDLDALSHLETALDSPPTPAFSQGANSFQTLRGAVLALDSPSNTTSVSHPSAVEDTGVLPAVTALPRGTFSLRGQLMHAFYRVSTEGSVGNGMSSLLAEKIRELSMDREQALQIPQHGWGIWPHGLKKPVPFRKEEAKVFLDRDNLLDGQSWLAGFVQGFDPNPHNLNPSPCTLNPEP